MEKVSNAQHRQIARKALENQWGRMAGFTFLSLLLSSLLGGIVSSVANFPPDSMQETILSTILSVFLFFAFTYALYYMALYVLRGGRAQANMLFVVFQGGYYVPMLIINLLNSIVNYALNLLVNLPILLTVGVSAYLAVTFGSNTANVQEVITSGIIDMSFVILTIVLLLVSAVLSMIISGYFEFVMWLKMDYPEITLGQAFAYAWSLLKDRIGSYLLLQLSFVGWFILGLVALVIGVLWVIPYQNVAVASFYDTALKEKGSPNQ